MALPGSGLIRFPRRVPAREKGPDAAEIIAAMPAALLVVDAENRVIEANAAAEALLFVSAAQIVGKPLAEVLIVPPAYSGERTDGVFAAYDVTLETPRGMRLRADFHAAPIPERAGWRIITLNSAASAHRMGHRHERGSAARAAVGAAAMLAHEIKNPLSGIRGAAQLLDARADADAKRLTSLIRNEVDRVTALIDRMELFTDTRALEPAPENIYAILDHVRGLAAAGFAAGVTVRDDYDPSLPSVLVHRDSMVQVLLNLLKNAVEAIDRNGEILITTAYRHGVSVTSDDGGTRLSLPIELCIVDTGPGAPAELSEHLFEPFVTSKTSGRGLGLALADKLVRDMGGIIQYAREGTPERTVFRLLLPRGDRRRA